MNDLIFAVLLGVIQGITEFLPISSSGHLILVSYFANGKVLPLALNIALHLGTLGAVLVYFRQDWLFLLKKFVSRITRNEKSVESDRIIPGLIIGTIPAGVIGILFEDEIEAIFHKPIPVAFMLATVGVILWIVDRKAKSCKKMSDLNYFQSFVVGVAQSIALIPGVSRSGSTIIGGRLFGLERTEAAKYSFMLGTPAMAGAALLEFKDIVASLHDPVLYIGVLASFLTGCAAIKFLLSFFQRNGMFAFMIYRLILAFSILLLLL